MKVTANRIRPGDIVLDDKYNVFYVKKVKSEADSTTIIPKSVLGVKLPDVVYLNSDVVNILGDLEY